MIDDAVHELVRGTPGERDTVHEASMSSSSRLMRAASAARLPRRAVSRSAFRLGVHLASHFVGQGV
jgi:hypothetical protein